MTPGSAEWRWVWLSPLILFAMSLLLLSQDFTVDGLQYATLIESGGALWHANHLLPNYLFRILYVITQVLGLDIRAVWVMQGFNLFAGAVGCTMLYVLCRHVSSRTNALAMSGLFYASFGWWNFSQEPEVYVLPLVLILGQLLVLIRPNYASRQSLTLLIGLCALTILLLQEHVIWYFAVAWLLIARAGTIRDRCVVLFGLCVPMIVFGVYVALGLAYAQLTTVDQSLNWFLGYAYSSEGGFDVSFRVAAPPGQRLVLALMALGNLLLPYGLVTLPYLVVALAIFCVLLVVAPVLIAAWHSSRDGAWIKASFPPGWLIGWALAYFGFTLVWEARNIEFMLPVLIPSVLFGALVMGHRRHRLIWSAVVALIVLNFWIGHIPASQFPERYALAVELDALQDLQSGDGLVTEEKNTVSYLNYWNRKDVRFIPGAVSYSIMIMVPLEQAAIMFQRSISASRRVFIMEKATRGRLLQMAKRMPWLGEGAQHNYGRIENRLYGDLNTIPVAGLDGVLQVQDVMRR